MNKYYLCTICGEYHLIKNDGVEVERDREFLRLISSNLRSMNKFQDDLSPCPKCAKELIDNISIIIRRKVFV